MSSGSRVTPVLHVLSRVYGRAASQRRAWYGRHPEARRRLGRPVISIGNLAVGGSGKTPLVAALARQLLDVGEHPSILTRGYARREPTDGVLVVSDARSLLEPVHRSGDEPQMLARALPGVPVLVAADRHLAGVLAEHHFGCTVHLLDDGFQHLLLWRDIDLLVVAPDNLDDILLPAGRLREPLAAAAAADVVLVPGDEEDAERVASATGIRPSYTVRTLAGAPKRLLPFGAAFDSAERRAIAVAGIARPERFFRTAREQGWDVASELVFKDHHWFTRRDVDRMLMAAEAAGASVILTTEKDGVRLLDLPLGVTSLPIVFLPVTAAIEPPASWAGWLRHRLAAAREERARQIA